MAQSGSLGVVLNRCAELKDMEIVGKQSPYAVLTVGSKTFKSKTVSSGCLLPARAFACCLPALGPQVP